MHSRKAFLLHGRLGWGCTNILKTHLRALSLLSYPAMNPRFFTSTWRNSTAQGLVSSQRLRGAIPLFLPTELPCENGGVGAPPFWCFKCTISTKRRHIALCYLYCNTQHDLVKRKRMELQGYSTFLL